MIYMLSFYKLIWRHWKCFHCIASPINCPGQYAGSLDHYACGILFCEVGWVPFFVNLPCSSTWIWAMFDQGNKANNHIMVKHGKPFNQIAKHPIVENPWTAKHPTAHREVFVCVVEGPTGSRWLGQGCFSGRKILACIRVGSDGSDKKTVVDHDN